MIPHAQNLIPLVRQAEALIEVNRFDEAGELLAQGLSQAPDECALLGLMAQVRLRQGRWKEARENAERAVAAEPEVAWPYRILSSVLRARAFNQESLRSAREAIRLGPEEAASWQNLALAEIQVARVSDARVAAEKLRELAPESYRTYQTLALVELKDGNFVSAESFSRKELELNPSSFHGMNNLGVALSRQNRKREAVAVFHQTAKLNPAEALAQKNLHAAVSRYIPRWGLGLGGAFVIFRVLYFFVGVFGVLNGILLEVALVAAVVGVILLTRWIRFRRMPADVRQYFNLLSAERKRENRRDLLIIVWVSAFVGFGAWWAVMAAFWDDLQPTISWFEFLAPPTALLGLGLVSLFWHWRIRRNYLATEE